MNVSLVGNRDDENNLKATKSKQPITGRGTISLLPEIAEAEGNRAAYSKCRKKKFQLQLLYPAELSYKRDGEIQTFPEKQRPDMQDVLQVSFRLRIYLTDGNLNSRKK